MQQVYQSKKHNPPESHGNCFAACFASILEISIDEVPPFEDLPGFDDGKSEAWLKVLNAWLKAHGLYASCHKVPNDIPHRKAPIGYAIATGRSPRGSWLHSVVFCDGQQVHDPAGTDAEPIDEIIDWIKIIPSWDVSIGWTEREVES